MGAAAPSGKGANLTNPQLVEMTLRACGIARSAAAALAQGLARASPELVQTVRQHEKELDALNREINDGVTSAITQVSEAEGREQLACLKFVLELERMGDLFLNVVHRAQAVGGLDPQDSNDLSKMASTVEKMLAEATEAFSRRDPGRTLAVLRADAEVDRVRNLVFMRHIENPGREPRQGSFHVLFMTQSLERAGDHVKNLAGEVCQLVSGRSIRHLLRADQKSFEEGFLEAMRQREPGKPNT